MSTIKTKTADVATLQTMLTAGLVEVEANELRLTCEGISGLTDTNIGTFGVASDLGKKAFEVYELAYKGGTLPSDLLPPNSEGSTATKESYASWIKLGEAKTWSPEDYAFMSLDKPLLKDKSKAAKAARDRRTELSERRRNAVRNYMRGLKTQDEIARPEEYKTDDKGADNKKTVQEKLSAPATTIVKILQGDGPFPENMDVVDGIALIQAWAKKMNVKIDIK